ncbi:hypothetical protein [Streptomyces sp. BPSDS2]|uniref:hypothetical protein n=1 Tax=Streptomyces sp. BPSDS2 TaxID=2571021 RepID=UPI0010C2050D|nr:hypothetical protein [Streptomyces sp. BPSDS2]
MATSAVPAAITALLALLTPAPALADVRVIDGPPPSTNFAEADRLYVGWSPGAEQAAEIQQEFASAGARTRDEEAAISCYIETREGGGDMAWCRARVFELLAVVEDLLRATTAVPDAPTLGGAVLWSELTAGSLIQEQTSDGAYAGLGFTVRTRARI